MAKYTRSELRKMAQEFLRAGNSSDPKDRTNHVMVLMFVSNLSGLSTEQTLQRIQKLAED